MFIDHLYTNSTFSVIIQHNNVNIHKIKSFIVKKSGTIVFLQNCEIVLKVVSKSAIQLKFAMYSSS